MTSDAPGGNGAIRAGDDSVGGRVSVAEHRAFVLSLMREPAPLSVVLGDALGAPLAEDVLAPIDLPVFDNSQMDGFAVRFADLAGAGGSTRLRVVGDVPAGPGAAPEIAAGQALRIMTGAPVPTSADMVVPVEWTDIPAGAGPLPASVQISVPDGEGARPGLYVRPRGDDLRAGSLVAAAGTRIGPRHIGLLAALGFAKVLVRPVPRVVVVSTGSELVEPGRELGPGQIYESNSHMLVAAMREMGLAARRIAHVADRPDDVREVLEDYLSRADLVVTTGGVSAGAFDTVKEVLSASPTMRFSSVAMQPGGPQGAGTLPAADGRAVPVITLPGNPVSSFVSFEAFVRPALRKLLGARELFRPVVEARVTEGFASVPGKEQLVRAILARADDGGYEVTKIGGHGSHLLAHMTAGNTLLRVPAAAREVPAGTVLECLVISDEFFYTDLDYSAADDRSAPGEGTAG